MAVCDDPRGGRDDFTGWRNLEFFLRGRYAGEVRRYRGYTWPSAPPKPIIHRDFTSTADARAWVESEARLLEVAELA